jgi:demethylmenaquinone methyltransferase/2-methoxy-6-polyprenyl-1,4-benzoquinol methylase
VQSRVRPAFAPNRPASDSRKRFMSTIDLQPNQCVLDVCAGTNAVGIALLTREPTLDVHAMDRSAHMQAVGKQRAEERGFLIKSTIVGFHRATKPEPVVK